ncbi:MAG TPA: Type 1 glutamine amidotransferase-like domain-containing protein [Candidatus Scatosoma pullicola]|nr:Type 1 glutamine amidotransferase-like domain-containing protein [Candidatus Scatosoma pullicola]
MKKRIIAIGGGEIKDKTTLQIDEKIAAFAKERAGNRRANALFIPTASHDFMPYYNSFHKVYTGIFDIKTDVALTVYREPDPERLKEKFLKADVIYVSGGDTVFMMEHWKKTGMLELIEEAYGRGVPIAGLSAGAICWFSDIYTDSLKTENGAQYAMFKGLNWIKGIISPHYGQRMLDFDKIVCYNYPCAYGIEDNAALLIEDGEIVGSLTSGGKAYRLVNTDGILEKRVVESAF